MSNRIKNILEFISIWGNSYFYSPLSENVYSPEALEKLADQIDAESGTEGKSVRAQRLRYLAKTRAERLKKLEAARDKAMHDDRDEETVRRIEGIQSRVIGAEKAGYDSSSKPGTSLVKSSGESGEVFKVLGKPNTSEEPEENSSMFSKLFGGIGRVAGGIGRVAGALAGARDFAGAVTKPVYHGNRTNVLGAVQTAANQVENAALIKQQIAELEKLLRNTTDPDKRKAIQQEILYLKRARTLSPYSRNFGVNRLTIKNPRSGSV